MIYTTNWIERLNKDFRRVPKTRNVIHSDESVLALLIFESYLIFVISCNCLSIFRKHMSLSLLKL